MSVLNQDLDQEMDQKGREIVPYDTVLGKHEQFQMNGKIEFLMSVVLLHLFYSLL